MDVARPLPQDQEAEKSILGAILIENKIFTDVLDIMLADDFYNTANKHIFNAMYQLYKDKQPIDTVTLAKTLGVEKLQAVGGLSYLVTLSEIPTHRHFKAHCKIVKEHSTRRNLIKSLSNALVDSWEGNLSDIRTNLSNSLIDTNTDKSKNYDMTEIMEMTLEKVEQAYQNGGKIVGLPTQIKIYDKYSNGIKKKEISIIAARPSIGKTAFTLNIMYNLTKEHKALMFQLEMGVEEIGVRMLAAESFVNGLDLQQGKLNDSEFEKVSKGANRLTQHNFKLNVEGGLSWEQIENRIKREKIQNGLDVVFIDHIGLIRVPNKNRNVEIGEITARAKALAKELDIAIVFLCQLNRGCEMRADKRPMLSDLRDSGNIEQDADLITFLYRDDYYNPQTEEKGIMETIIAKNRNGLVGTVKLSYVKEFQLITDIEKLEG